MIVFFNFCNKPQNATRFWPSLKIAFLIFTIHFVQNKAEISPKFWTKVPNK